MPRRLFRGIWPACATGVTAWVDASLIRTTSPHLPHIAAPHNPSDLVCAHADIHGIVCLVVKDGARDVAVYSINGAQWADLGQTHGVRSVAVETRLDGDGSPLFRCYVVHSASDASMYVLRPGMEAEHVMSLVVPGGSSQGILQLAQGIPIWADEAEWVDGLRWSVAHSGLRAGQKRQTEASPADALWAVHGEQGPFLVHDGLGEAVQLARDRDGRYRLTAMLRDGWCLEVVDAAPLGPPVRPEEPPGPVPPPEPPAPPTPPPGGPVTGLDLAAVTWLHTDVSHWPKTSELVSVRFRSDSLSLEHTKRHSWPAVTINGTALAGNPWVFAQIDGQWYAATYEWLRPGQLEKSITRATIGVHTKRPPLERWIPAPGELVGFMVSTLARGEDRTLNERSDVVLVRWGEDAILWREPAGAGGPAPWPTPTPVPPAPPPSSLEARVAALEASAVRYGDGLSLWHPSHAGYLVAEDDAERTVRANRAAQGPWETWRVDRWPHALPEPAPPPGPDPGPVPSPVSPLWHDGVCYPTPGRESKRFDPVILETLKRHGFTHLRFDVDVWRDPDDVLEQCRQAKEAGFKLLPIVAWRHGAPGRSDVPRVLADFGLDWIELENEAWQSLSGQAYLDTAGPFAELFERRTQARILLCADLYDYGTGQSRLWRSEPVMRFIAASERRYAAIHPYRGQRPPTFSAIAADRGRELDFLRQRYGHDRIVVTEIGWRASTAQRAAYYVEEREILRQAGVHGWYAYVHTADPISPERDHGLTDVHGQPRPALIAMRDAIAPVSGPDPAPPDPPVPPPPPGPPAQLRTDMLTMRDGEGDRGVVHPTVYPGRAPVTRHRIRRALHGRGYNCCLIEVFRHVAQPHIPDDRDYDYSAQPEVVEQAIDELMAEQIWPILVVGEEGAPRWRRYQDFRDLVVSRLPRLAERPIAGVVLGVELDESAWSWAEMADLVGLTWDLARRPVWPHFRGGVWGEPGRELAWWRGIRAARPDGQFGLAYQYRMADKAGGGFLATEAEIRQQTARLVGQLTPIGVSFIAGEHGHRRDEATVRARGQLALRLGADHAFNGA